MEARVKLALVLAVLVAMAAASAGEPNQGKTRASANGLYGIRLVQQDGSCRVEAVKEQEVVWTLAQCVGTVDDLFFISNDSERFWVLYPLPEIPSGRRSRSPVLEARVAALYDRAGAVLQTRRLADFIKQPHLGEVRLLGKHFKWLEGLMAVPGNPPRTTDQNEVELEVVTHEKHRLKF